jgi:ubiquinone/menaquinone biosynthesis C-methylase UbiE
VNAEPLPTTAVKDAVWSHWGGRAATFDAAPNHGLHNGEQRRAWRALIERWAGSPPIDALDVGCGTGFLALQLAALGHRVAGLDGAEQMLALARSKAAEAALSLDLRLGDAEALPFGPASFDLVIERHVLWTLPNPATALAEWARVLRPGGRLVLIEGVGGGTVNPDYERIRGALPLFGGRPAEVLAELAATAGLVGAVSQPLMDEVLWGRAVERERYALLARKPD